jgi:hypothetical protein
MLNTKENLTRYIQISNQIKVGEKYRFFRIRVVARFNAKKNVWVKDHTSIEFTERQDFHYLSPSYWDITHDAHIPESALRSLSSITAYVKKHPELGFIYDFAGERVEQSIQEINQQYQDEIRQQEIESRKNAFMEEFKALLKKHNAKLSGSVYAPYEEASGGVDIQIGDDPSFEILDLKDNQENIFEI